MLDDAIDHTQQLAADPENTVLGAILLKPECLADVQAILSPDDFKGMPHRVVYVAMLDLNANGSGIDVVTLTDHLRKAGHLQTIGGGGFLGELVEVVPSSANVKAHARLIQQRAHRRRLKAGLLYAIEAIDTQKDATVIERILREAAESRNGEASPRLKDAVLSFQDLARLQLPERPRLFSWLPEGGLCMAFGPRGVGKTFFNLTLAASLATGTPFFRWKPSRAAGVLYIDGEMDLEELRGRLTSLLPCKPEAPLRFLTSHFVYTTFQRDLVLTDEAVRNEIMTIFDETPELKVLILDNISCLFSGIDEDSKRSWEPIAAWLIRLRHRGITVFLVHHSGKQGQQRGTSGREDALDTVIQLTKPADYVQSEGCRFELNFQKCRSSKGEDLEPLDARLIEHVGRLEWSVQTLTVSREEQARRLYAEGVTRPCDLAEEMSITKGYASKLIRKIKTDVGG